LLATALYPLRRAYYIGLGRIGGSDYDVYGTRSYGVRFPRKPKTLQDPDDKKKSKGEQCKLLINKVDDCMCKHS